jgi:4-hydroxy-tetrahydrodipicolinate synthase
MDIVGRFGGPCRPPRGPLTEQQELQVREETERARKAMV